MLRNGRRLTSYCSIAELQKRFAAMHVRYLDGIIQQVAEAATAQHEMGRYATIRNIQQHMELRTLTIGVYPAITLCEYAGGVKLPEHVFQHPSLQECMHISSELVSFVNDVVSFKKDQALGMADFNIVSLIKAQGTLTTQDAMDVVGEMVRECNRRWYRALAELPVYGAEIDREVLRFVDVCRDVALGNLHWR